MSNFAQVSNSATANNPDLPVRSDPDADGNLRQVFRLDVGTGTGEALVSGGSPLPTETKLYAVRLDEVSTTLNYVGEAVPGTADGAAAWRIKKIDMTSGVVLTWADGNTNFDNIWSNRAGLTYS